MEKRTCKSCGTDNYSADTSDNWECCKCGATISISKDENNTKIN